MNPAPVAGSWPGLVSWLKVLSAVANCLNLGGDQHQLAPAAKALEIAQQNNSGVSGFFDVLIQAYQSQKPLVSLGSNQQWQSGYDALTTSRDKILQALRQGKQGAVQAMMAQVLISTGACQNDSQARQQALELLRDSNAFSTPANTARLDEAIAEQKKAELAQQRARSAFAVTLQQARTANEQLTSIQSQVAQLQAQAQNLMRQYQQQATGGMAARGKLSQTAAKLEGVLGKLRALYSQANAPVAALKQAAAQMQQIRAGAGGEALAPETVQAQRPVARWAEAANGWRAMLSKTINHQMAPWLKDAYDYLQQLGAKVTHTRTSTGSAVGAPADGVNQRHLQEQAKLLQRLAEQAYDQLNTGMNLGGFEEYLRQLAEANGVSEAALKSAVRSFLTAKLQGLQGGAAVRASVGSGAASVSKIDSAVGEAGEQLSNLPVLRRMSEGGLTPQQWHAWAHHRYHLAQGLFQNLLEECIAAATKLRDDFSQGSAEWKAANNLVENLKLNLKDEEGGWRNPNDADYRLAPHETWRQRAYQALAEELRRHGLGDPRQSTLQPEGNRELISDVFANRVREMIAKAKAPNATSKDRYSLIGLFLGVEAGIPTEYSQVLPGLERDFPGSFGDPRRELRLREWNGAELYPNPMLPGWVRNMLWLNREYFSNHISHDKEHHLPGITDPLKQLLVNSPELLHIVINEIKAITEAKLTFYQKLGEQNGIGLPSH